MQWKNMQKRQQQLEEMAGLLSSLIDAAKKLKEAVSLTIAENELAHLQEKQNVILQKLVELDKKLNASKPKTEAEIAQYKKIEKELREFEKLNKDFFLELQGRLSLIQFAAPKEN